MVIASQGQKLNHMVHACGPLPRSSLDFAKPDMAKTTSIPHTTYALHLRLHKLHMTGETPAMPHVGHDKGCTSAPLRHHVHNTGPVTVEPIHSRA